MTQSKGIRKTNFEIVRIVAMIAITLSHVPFAAPAGSIMYYLGKMNFCFGGFGDNLFVLVGVWFLVESKPKMDRIFRLFFQVVFYSLVLSLISFALGSSITVGKLWTTLSYWFPFGYVFMLIVFPYLKKINRKIKIGIVISVGVIITLITMLRLLGFDNPVTRLFSKGLFLGPFWFSFLFIFVDCMKDKLKWLFSRKKAILLCAFIILQSLMTFLVARFDLTPLRTVYSPLCLLSSIFLFGCFVDLQMRDVLWINKIATAAFGVYLIQCNQFFRFYVWEKWFDFEQYSASKPLYYFAGIITAIIVMICCAYTLDIIWRFIYKQINKLNPVSKLYSFLEKSLYKHCI